VCAMVRPPTREAEDTRRINREREALLAERIRHANRIKGLLATQGVFGFEPTLRDRRACLAAVRTPEKAALPPRLAAEIERQMDRLELATSQLAAVEAARDAVLAAEDVASPPSAAIPHAVACGTFGCSAQDAGTAVGDGASGTAASLPQHEGPGARLLRLKGIGPETASVLAGEAFFRDFRNRREVASYAGLAPSPWQSGGVDHEQGISKAGNARVRKTMGEACKGSACVARGKQAEGSWPGCGCATSRTVR